MQTNENCNSTIKQTDGRAQASSTSKHVYIAMSHSDERTRAVLLVYLSMIESGHGLVVGGLVEDELFHHSAKSRLHVLRSLGRGLAVPDPFGLGEAHRLLQCHFALLGGKVVFVPDDLPAHRLR